MKIINNLLIAAVLLVVVVIGYQLRNTRYSTIPFPGESTDEYSNAWVGLSLIQLGFPIGIGGLPTYPSHDYRYINVDRIFSSNTVMGNAIPLDYPWFDHPPLMGAVTGGYAYLRGARVFEDATTAIIRKPVVFVSIASLVLIFWLGSLTLGTGAGLVASIMAFSPLMVINSRMVQAENFIVPIFLSSLIALYYYLHGKGRYTLYLSAILAGLGILFKLSGASILISGLTILLISRLEIKQKIKDISLFLLIVLGFFSIYLVMGLVYDWPLFLKTILGNSNRKYGIGFHSIFELLTITKVTGKIYLSDGWPLLGWVSVVSLFVKKLNLRTKYIVVPLISYFIIYIFFGSESFGWYRIPFFPFIYLAGGYMLASGYESLKNLIPSVLFLFIPIGVAVDKLNALGKLNIPVSYWRFGLPTIIFLSLLFYYFKKNRWAKTGGRLLWIFVFILALIVSYRYTNVIDITYWFKVN